MIELFFLFMSPSTETFYDKKRPFLDFLKKSRNFLVETHYKIHKEGTSEKSCWSCYKHSKTTDIFEIYPNFTVFVRYAFAEGSKNWHWCHFFHCEQVK